MNKYTIIILAFLMVVYSPCPAAPQLDKQITVQKNITYTKIGDQKLQFDLARPIKCKDPLPLLIYIHGGGWKEGHRSAYQGEIKQAARRGYVAVTMSHRLTAEKNQAGQTKYPWPAAIYDVKACICYLKANADKYNIDPNTIGITGASSGGHLALLAGLTDKSDGLEGPGHRNISSRVQAVVNVAGPTDMAKVHLAPVVTSYVELFLGGTPQEQPGNYRQATPLEYISKDDPPILTIHSESDLVVPVEHALLLDQKAQKVGAFHDLKILKPENIIPRNHNLSKGVNLLTLDFFDQYLKK